MSDERPTRQELVREAAELGYDRFQVAGFGVSEIIDALAPGDDAFDAHSGYHWVDQWLPIGGGREEIVALVNAWRRSKNLPPIREGMSEGAGDNE